MEKEIIETEQAPVTSTELLNHWQGHRRLSRRVIQAFPDDKLFTYSIGGMRPFSELALEMIKMAGPGIHGMVTGEWVQYGDMKQFTNNAEPKTKEDLLAMWDEVTTLIDEQWPNIPAHRFHEKDIAFGQYEGTITSFLFYFIDNEVHHRGQGYVYLRALGIEPPFFWERD